MKLAAYLDEAGDDPVDACRTLLKHGINYTVLRHLPDFTNIVTASDKTCKSLRDILNSHNISAVAIISNIGDVPANMLDSVDVGKAFDVATYFSVPAIRIGIGTKTKQPCDISKWLSRITDISFKYNMIPLLEITHDSYYSESGDVLGLLRSNKRWKLLYDPVQLILKRRIDPYTRYWQLLRKYVYAVDVRDVSVGKGFKPPGFGDSKIREVIYDIVDNNWLFIEPGLGRKYGKTKSETFSIAMEGFKMINLNETIQRIKSAGAGNVRAVPMNGQHFQNGNYQIEVSVNGVWTPIVSGIYKNVAEDIITQATNKVLLG